MNHAEHKSCRGELVGLLASGGLDSCILLRHLLDVGHRVKPFYVHSGLFWQDAEFAALQRYIAATPKQCLEPLTFLDLPLADVYANHWSITGQDVPAADSPDDDVYLPGRTVFLTAKAALWCQMHDIGALALATLRSNPFEDASGSFLDNWQTVLNEMWPRSIRVTCPFGKLDKRQVMEIGRDYPLELTFSCISPGVDQLHCGRCNKCAERQAAFRLSGLPDPTTYNQSTCCVS